MNILIIAPFLPHPDAPSGNPRAVFDRARLLSTAHRLTVATFTNPGEKDRIKALRELGITVHGVVRDPEAGTSGLALWKKRVRLAAGLLNLEKPMLAQEFYDPRMTRLLSTLLKREHFDLILVEHILMAQYIDHLNAQTTPPVILTEHDARLAFPNIKSTEKSKIQNPKSKIIWLARFERMRWRRYETRQCRRADALLVPSEEDAALLAKEVPGLEPLVVPFGVAPTLYIQQEASSLGASENESVLFVGNFDHPPNVDAALWLCGEIMPLVWQDRPRVEVWLVGKNPTREVKALAGKQVVVTGEVPSVAPYLRHATLFVAPLRLGGGTRIKLIEAMGAGATVITTTVGAQGLGALPGKHLLVSDDARGLASSIIQAISDPTLRERLRAAGQALVTSQTGEKERLERLNNIIEKVSVGSLNREL